MADEITARISVSIPEGALPFSQTYADTFDQAVAGGGNPGIVSVTTTAANLSFTGLTQRGFALVRNLDTSGTNYVQFGVDVSGTFTGVIELKAGEYSWIRWARSGTLQAKAVGGTVRVSVHTFED